MSQFHQRLREYRLSRQLLQREMAVIAGIKIRAYQLYEQGKTEPGIDVLIKFADIFQVSLDDLVGRTFTPPAPGASAGESRECPLAGPNDECSPM